jgi:hypothetical protein
MAQRKRRGRPQLPTDIGKARIEAPPPPDDVTDLAIRDLKPHQAKQVLIQRDIRNGNLRMIWDKMVEKAKSGDTKAQDRYWDRVFGRPGQQVAVATEVRHSMSDEDREVLGGVLEAFGLKRKFVESVSRPVE